MFVEAALFFAIDTRFATAAQKDKRQHSKIPGAETQAGFMNQLLILTAYSFHFVRYGVLFPLIPLVAESMGAGAAVIGITVGAFSLIAIFLSIPLGGLTDRFGVKRLLLLGVVCNIVSAVILLSADTIAALFLVQTIAGVGFLLHVVASQAYFSRLPRAADREKGFGFISFAAAVGQGLGPLLGGFLADCYGYPAAFGAVLAFSVVGLVVLGVKDSAEVRAVKSTFSLSGDLQSVWRLLQSGRVRIVLLFAFVVIFAVSLRNSFLPVFLITRGLGEAGVGFLIALFAAASTSIRLFFGFLLNRLSRRAVTALAVAAVALGVGTIPLMPSPGGYAAALVVFGLGFGLSQPLSMVMMSDLAEARVGGLAMGLRFTAIMAANLSSPVMLGLMAEAVGLPFVFFAAAALVTMFGVATVVLRPNLLPQRREEHSAP
jgi:MFS family permease